MSRPARRGASLRSGSAEVTAAWARPGVLIWAAESHVVVRAALLECPPSASAVVGDDLREDGGERSGVDRPVLVGGDGARRLVVVAAGDDVLGVVDDAA